MRTFTLAGLLLLLLFSMGPGSLAVADDKHDLSEAMAKELVAKAASASSRYLNAIVALGAKLTAKDLTATNVDAPMTVVAAVMGGKDLDERDFKLLPTATPKAFAEAIYPEEVRAGQRVPKHAYASIVHGEYVYDIDVKVNGRTATGGVRFRAPGAYEGFVNYTAFRDAAGWKVLELSFPHSQVRTTLEAGRWRLHLPASLTGARSGRRTDLDLPHVGTLGQVPSAGPGRVVISVTREGWLRVPGVAKPLSLHDLQQYLKTRTRDPALREPDGSSRVDALLDIDKTIPWTVTQWIMQTCAHPESKIYKIWFGAQTQDGASGAIASMLGKDRGLAPTPAFPREFIKHKLKVFKIARFKQPSGLRALYWALKKRHDASARRQRPEAKFEIVAPPPKGGAVPHGYVVQMVDVCLAVGARDIIFEGSAAPLRGHPLLTSAEALRGHIEELRKRQGVPRVRLNNDKDFIAPDDEGLAPMPARGLLTQRYGAGVSLQAEVIEEDLEETPEDDGDLPFEESFGETPEGPKLKDEPFEGPADNGSIGIGGGAGGAFRGRGGRRDLRPDLKKLWARQDRSVDAALRWLAAHQAPNGGWPAAGFGNFCDGKPVSTASKRPDGLGKSLYDAGVTGLALQAFLGAGYTNRGRHPYAKVVSRGLRYLKNIQDPEGCFGPRATQQYIYNHAMGALAMVEAYGMTQSPIFRGSAQRCLDFIAIARNPYFAWRYGIKPGDNDTSVTGWMFAILTSADMINRDAIKHGRQAPLTIDKEAFAGAQAWLEKVTDPATGRVGYVQRGTGPARPQELVDRFPGKRSESMTAVGALMRIYLGEDPRKSSVLAKSLALIASKPPIWNPSSGDIDMYYWHWGTQAMYQAGGERFQAWRSAMTKSMLDTQRMDTDACQYKGSWDPIGPWGLDGGRVYSTAIMALCLQVRYRYARVFGK